MSVRPFGSTLEVMGSVESEGPGEVPELLGESEAGTEAIVILKTGSGIGISTFFNKKIGSGSGKRILIFHITGLY